MDSRLYIVIFMSYVPTPEEVGFCVFSPFDLELLGSQGSMGNVVLLRLSSRIGLRKR